MRTDALYTTDFSSGGPELNLLDQVRGSDHATSTLHRVPKLNVKPTYRPAAVPDYTTPQRRAKLEAFNKILGPRLTTARNKGLFPSDNDPVLQALSKAIELFVQDQRFSALTVRFREDESIELARVNGSKSNKDYLVLRYDEDIRDVRASFSRFVGKKSTLHESDTLATIFQQIVGLTEV